LIPLAFVLTFSTEETKDQQASIGGNIMERFCVDCRDYKGPGAKCTVAISADSKEELLEAAVQHGIAVHGFKDTPEFRNQILTDFIKTGVCAN